MAILNNAINLNATTTQPVGTATSQDWQFTGTFGVDSPDIILATGAVGSSYTDATALNVDGVTLTIGPTLASNIFAGNSKASFTIPCSSYSLVSASTLNCVGITGSTYTDNVSLNLDSESLTIGTSQATSLTVGSADASVGLYGVDITLAGQNGSSLTDASVVTLDAPITYVAPTSASALHIGNASCTTTINGTTLEITNLSSQTGATAAAASSHAPSHVAPSGWANVIVNTSTGELAYYVQT